MLHLSNQFLHYVSTRGADGTQPSTTQGTSVTPGASNTYGSYASLGTLHATLDTWEVRLFVHSVATAATNRMCMVTLGIDPAGGTSFTDTWSDVIIGGPAALSIVDRFTSITLPFRIPAGATVGVKAASLDATTTAIRAWVDASFMPTRPELCRVGAFVQTFGVTSPTVAGVSITPGTASEGSWVEIGTLDKPLWYFTFGMTVDDTTVSQAMLNVDLGIGDASNKLVIIRDALVWSATNEAFWWHGIGAHADGAVGDKIYARAQMDVTPDAAYTIAAYGVGG